MNLIYTIASSVIIPHGITDLTHCKKQNLIYLLLTYILSFIFVIIVSYINQYFHIVTFLISSLIHFKDDFIYLNYSNIISFLLSSLIIIIPIFMTIFNLLYFAKIFILSYMIILHVPLHYKKVSIKRIDIITIVLLSIIMGLYIPSILIYIENNNLNSFECKSLISLVLGHTIWNKYK